LAKETPRIAAMRLAQAKAAAARARHPHAYVLAADTVVAVGRRILGKPASEAEARRFLGLISGRAHRVLSAVQVIAPDGRSGARLSESRLLFKRLTPSEVDACLFGDEWRDKAGAYAIQGRAGAFVVNLAGSYSGVVGLPLYETACLLEGLGFHQ
jgi:septum formation protein